MKLDDIKDEIKKDSEISDKLDHEALKIPYLYGKWINQHAMEKAYMVRYKRDKDSMILWKMDYYKGVSNPEYKNGKTSPVKYDTKAERERALSGDKEILDMIDKVELQKIKVEAIELFLKAINTMGFNIQSAIKYMIWKSGG